MSPELEASPVVMAYGPIGEESDDGTDEDFFVSDPALWGKQDEE